MNKRSAMVIAGGLVAALVSAIGAVSAGFTSGTAAEARPTQALRPKVRTITRTITVHKKPKHQTPAPVHVVTVGPSGAASPAPVTVSSGSLSSGHEDEHEDEGFEHEDAEHEGGDD
ncbi:MAG: hypothetical protein ACE14W_01440 [Candidatus Velamenicoccus archaeovorus]